MGSGLVWFGEEEAEGDLVLSNSFLRRGGGKRSAELGFIGRTWEWFKAVPGEV